MHVYSGCGHTSGYLSRNSHNMMHPVVLCRIPYPPSTQAVACPPSSHATMETVLMQLSLAMEYPLTALITVMRVDAHVRLHGRVLNDAHV